jgi:transcriptional regulator with XRE-family HTH domain
MAILIKKVLDRNTMAVYLMHQRLTMGVGKRIRTARIRAGLKQHEAARAVGRARPTWANYEAERITVPGDMIGTIARLLKVTTDWILLGKRNHRDGQ